MLSRKVLRPLAYRSTAFRIRPFTSTVTYSRQSYDDKNKQPGDEDIPHTSSSHSDGPGQPNSSPASISKDSNASGVEPGQQYQAPQTGRMGPGGSAPEKEANPDHKSEKPRNSEQGIAAD